MVRILSSNDATGYKHIHSCEDCRVVAEFDLADIKLGGGSSGTFVIKCPGCKTQFFKRLDRLPTHVQAALQNQ